MYKVSLYGITIHAPVGCFEAERRVGNRFEVDVELDVECDAAAQADQLEGTLNYVGVYDIVRRETAVPSRILENVAYRITEALYAEFGRELVKQIKVKVSKIAPPVGGKVAKASVECVR